MAKTKVPLITEAQELGLEPIIYYIGQYEHMRRNTRDMRAELSSAQSRYDGKPISIKFPVKNIGLLHQEGLA